MTQIDHNMASCVHSYFERTMSICMTDKESAGCKNLLFELPSATDDNHSASHAFGSACCEFKPAKSKADQENTVHWFAHCLLICNSSGETRPRKTGDTIKSALYILKNLQDQPVSG